MSESLNNNDENVMYILVNTNLKMSKGKIASQCCHSLGLATRILERYKPIPGYYEDWLKNGEPIIILGTTQEELEKLIEQYPPNNIEDYWCVHIRDKGRTQVKQNSLTAVAFRPIVRSSVPQIFKNFKLL